MIMVAIIAIVVASAEAVATTSVYVQNQNATTIQQRNYSNTITAIPKIKGLNASTIIDAINSLVVSKTKSWRSYISKRSSTRKTRC